MVFNETIHTLQHKAFNIVIIIMYILYVAIIFGISVKAPEYLDTLQYFIKLYISLFLIYRFNPFRHIKFTELDTKIAFSAGWFLLTTTFFNGKLIKYLSDINIKKFF